MAKRQVFYSFHFKNDVMRVQLVRNMGVIDGNKPVSPNDWEEVKRKGSSSIENWIDDNMAYRSCVIVLVGSETANRQWVQYEIKKAWNENKGLVGVYIHNLKDPINGICRRGTNPFDQFNVNGVPLSNLVKCHDPNPLDAYNDIRYNLEMWIEDAIQDATQRI